MRSPHHLALLCCAVGTAAAASSSHSHLFRVTDDLPSLLTPEQPSQSRSGRRMTSDEAATIIHAARTPSFSIEYTAKSSRRHTLRLLEPGLASSISSISCNATHVAVHMFHAKATSIVEQRFAPGVIISGACITDGDGEGRRPFYREAHSILACSATLFFESVDVPLHQAFDALQLDLRLHGLSMPASHPVRPDEPPPIHSTPDQPPLHRRRRLFLDRIVAGDLKGALNDLGEGVVDAAGKLLVAGGRLIGDVVGGALDGFADSSSDGVASVWGRVSDTLRKLFDGFKIKQEVRASLTTLNFDPSSGRALNRSVRLHHAPWATCEDCFFAANLSAALSLEFAPGGIPTAFHAEVGLNMQGRVFLNLESPAPAIANDMGNWHTLVPRVRAGTFSFVVGYVPVTIDLGFEANAAAWADTAMGPDVSMSAGVETSAEARFGVHWSDASGWQRVQHADWNHSYWLPAWGGRSDLGNASIRASVSPEISMTVWGIVPLEVKPKIVVGWHLGRSATMVPEHPPYLGLPLHEAVSLLPPLHHQVRPPAVVADASKATTGAAARCVHADEYALSSGLNVGVGVGDVRIPAAVLPVAGGATSDLTVVGGVDFGEATLLPEATFPACGALCRGCLSDYVEHRQQYEAAAFATSANAVHGATEQRGELAGTTVAILVLGLLLATALAVVAILVRLLVVGRSRTRAKRGVKVIDAMPRDASGMPSNVSVAGGRFGGHL